MTAVNVPVDPAPVNAVTRFLRLIRFSHTIFALPFALGALLVAAKGQPAPRLLLLVLLCMVFARTAAMLFNRLVDWSIDQKNPRTAARHLLLTKPVIGALLALSSIAFLAASAVINETTAWLGPVALAIIFFYSLTKRFTNTTHFFLGLARGRAGRRLDRANRPTRLAAPGSGSRCDLLGARLRSDLRDPGR